MAASHTGRTCVVAQALLPVLLFLHSQEWLYYHRFLFSIRNSKEAVCYRRSAFSVRRSKSMHGGAATKHVL
jgi:hypothetical protein